jgi:hypothetical protein
VMSGEAQRPAPTGPSRMTIRVSGVGKWRISSVGRRNPLVHSLIFYPPPVEFTVWSRKGESDV